MATLKIPVTSDDHILGDFHAPITLVEYGDYQCSFCGQAYFIVKKLQDHYNQQLRLVFRNFPLTEIHPYAAPAAETAEFAADQGRFWDMHDFIYENQHKLDIPLLFDLAATLGLSANALASAIENKMYEPKIRRDFLGGARSGVNGTPTFFINDQRYNGPWEFESFVQIIDSIFAK